MSDLISRSALLKKTFDADNGWGIVKVVEARDIKAAPAVDAVEVVRCKDCVMHNECRFEQYQGLNGFCSLGERKENG